MRELILASTSKYRRRLLEQLRLDFTAVAPDYVEENDDSLEPTELVMEQALGKAQSLADRFPDALILGSDQVAECEGRILTKPGTAARAREQLASLRGREHRLLTAVALFDARTGEWQEHLDITRLRVREDLSEREIASYVELDNPIDCAGSYKIESLGPTLFDYLRGDDPSAVVGLPLMAVARMLRTVGHG